MLGDPIWRTQSDSTQPKDYFEFVGPDDIRIKGHRIGIDDVLYYYLEGYTPEEIAANLPTLSLEQIHATITYYLHNRAEVDAYLSRLAQTGVNSTTGNGKPIPPPVVQHLRALKAQRAEEQLAIA